METKIYVMDKSVALVGTLINSRYIISQSAVANAFLSLMLILSL